MSPTAVKAILLAVAENKHYPAQTGHALWFRPEHQLVESGWALFKDKTKRCTAIQQINKDMWESRRKAGLSLPTPPSNGAWREQVILCDNIQKNRSGQCRETFCARGALVHLPYLGNH